MPLPVEVPPAAGAKGRFEIRDQDGNVQKQLSPEEVEALKARSPAVARFAKRGSEVRVRPRFTPKGLDFKHDGTTADHIEQYATALSAFGTMSPAFMNVALASLEHVTRARGGDAKETSDAMDAAVALVRSVGAQTELEAALATQMAATHTLSLELLGRARHTDSTDALERYVGMATKLSRTFAAQLEALSRHRGAGRQIVEVTHTHIDARGSQNVIGEVRGGGGDTLKSERQACGPVARVAAEPGAALRGPEQGGEPLRIASGAREGALQDTRRSPRKRRTEGQG